MMMMMSLSPWTETASWMSSLNRWEPAHTTSSPRHQQALGDHVSLLSQAQGSYTPVPGLAALRQPLMNPF